MPSESDDNVGLGAPDAHARADAQFHDRTAHVYEDTLAPIFRPYVDLSNKPWLDAHPPSAPGAAALDVGCGTGALTLQLAERGYRVSGVDHSKAMLEIAMRAAANCGVADRLDLSVADVRALPFEADTFEVATCQGLLHHLVDMRPCLGEMARVLKPGGGFYLAEPCHGSTPAIRALEGAASLKARLRGGVGAGAPEPDDDHEEGPIDVSTLAAILDDLGLSYHASFWSRFPGVHRLPLALHRSAISLLSRPWARRSGNLVVVWGQKPS